MSFNKYLVHIKQNGLPNSLLWALSKDIDDRGKQRVRAVTNKWNCKKDGVGEKIQ